MTDHKTRIFINKIHSGQIVDGVVIACAYRPSTNVDTKAAKDSIICMARQSDRLQAQCKGAKHKLLNLCSEKTSLLDQERDAMLECTQAINLYSERRQHHAERTGPD